MFSTVVRYFKSLTRTIISSGLWNSHRMYCFSFSLNWSSDSLCYAVVLRTAQKSLTYPFKFLIDDVYSGRLKRPPCPPCSWLPPLSVQPHCTHPWPQLLVLDFFVMSEAQVSFVSLPSPPLLPATGEAVCIFGVILIYIFLSG